MNLKYLCLFIGSGDRLLKKLLRVFIEVKVDLLGDWFCFLWLFLFVVNKENLFFDEIFLRVFVIWLFFDWFLV